MIARLIIRALGAAVFALVTLAPAAHAQQASPASVALARQILELKGGLGMFDPLVDNIINGNKGTFLQMDPTAQRDLDVIAAGLSKEFAPKREEMRTEIARIYASQFTEQELKDALAFYRSPLGKKLIEAEPKAGEQTMQAMEKSAAAFVEKVQQRMREELRKKGRTQF
jgi:hypothetical protein